MATEGSARESTDSPGEPAGLALDRTTIGRGVVAGLASYAVGYLLAFLVAFGKVGETIPEFVPAWKGGWWFFYNAHVVDITLSASGGITSTTTGSFLGNSTDPVVQFLYLVPPAVLLISGGLLARHLNCTADTTEAAKAGGLVIAGYFPLALVGVFLTTHSGTTSATAGFLDVSLSVSYSIQLIPALLLAGTIYPLLFGALGGAAASVLADA